MNPEKKLVVSGIFYTALSKYSGMLVTLLLTAILARMLSPDDFGVVAVASVVIAFFSMFTDIGFSAAIVQYKTLTKEDLASLFSLTLWLGVLLSVAFFLSAGLIAAYYERPVLEPVCRILSVNLFFASANIVPNALFYKQKAFKYIAVRGVVVQCLAGILAIIVAWQGGGLYALLVNPVLSGILLFLISFRRYPQRILLKPRLSVLRQVMAYSTFQFLFNLINYFSRNLDKILIGKYMGMGTLGYYEKSYRLMMLPLQNITQVITPVMHPVLSDLQDDRASLASSYEKVVKLLAHIGFPLSVFLFFSAQELVVLMFGDQWLPSVPVFRLLSLSVGIQMVLSSSGSVFQAAGDTRSLFICGIFSSCMNIAGILLGIFYFKTLHALACCICITFSINFVQCYLQLYCFTLRRNMVYFTKFLISPFVISFILAGCLLLISMQMEEVNPLLALLVKGIASLLIWLIYVQCAGIYPIKPCLWHRIC